MSNVILDNLRETLKKQFSQKEPLSNLFDLASDTIDDLLKSNFPNLQNPFCLIAIGGYGRGELFLHSDIDILILFESPIATMDNQKIQKFLLALWDCGLKLGASTRTLAQTLLDSKTDLNLYTSLLESRLIVGDKELFQILKNKIQSQSLWSHKDFYTHKIIETQQRHEKYNNSAYRLEPDIKNSPGGLRDIQLLYWLTKKYFNKTELSPLLNQSEITRLHQAKLFLSKLRYALHNLTDKNEERLLFDYQKELAEFFDYKTDATSLGLEKLMKDYYRTVKTVRELYELFVVCYQEIDAPPPKRSKPIDNIFLFLNKIANNPDKNYLHSDAIRLLTQVKNQINTAFRDNPENKEQFIQIFQTQGSLSNALRLMNRFDILGAYLPCFHKIIGQMQYDLFHIYTVDHHTLTVIENCENFLIKDKDNFPLCHQLFSRMEHKEIIYLAALFHDIAKGRGGDHSELGCIDAENFCLQHSLSKKITEQIIWLVKNHLLLSDTAQRKDITDPNVINTFVEEIKNLEYLNSLYILTVADIRGTDPKLWNSWKAQLLKDLYLSARNVIEQEKPSKLDLDIIKQQALEALSSFPKQTIHALWDNFTKDYFYRHKPKDIAWESDVILTKQSHHKIIIAINNSPHIGGTRLLVYCQKSEYLFARTTALLDKLNLNIVDADICETKNNYHLASYILLESQSPISDKHLLDEIKFKLKTTLKNPHQAPNLSKPFQTRRARHFSKPSRINFTLDTYKNRTLLQLITPDRRGLLARVGLAFVKENILLHKAKIFTIGERVEDQFFITDNNNQPLNQTQQDTLASQLITLVDE